VIVVVFTTTTAVAPVPPNATVAPAAKFVPVIVTLVPPAVDPLFGDTALTVAGAVRLMLAVFEAPLSVAVTVAV
jgi:hypothetical protein